MLGEYYAGTYWLARRESAEACARRAEFFFRLLGRCDPAWNHWHDTHGSEEGPEVSLDAVTFARMFGRKEYQEGSDGFRLWFWGGDTVQEATSARISCGSSTPWAPSSCVLTIPDEGPLSQRVLTAHVMTEVLRAMVLAWEPEWGIATSYEHRQRVAERASAGTFTGWVMYFSTLRGPVPPLPAPVRVEPVEDKGTLVILTPERFTASNPEHVTLADRVQDVLNGAGLLRPLQPWPARRG